MTSLCSSKWKQNYYEWGVKERIKRKYDDEEAQQNHEPYKKKLKKYIYKRKIHKKKKLEGKI